MDDLSIGFRIELVSDDIVGRKKELYTLFCSELEHFGCITELIVFAERVTNLHAFRLLEGVTLHGTEESK